MFIDDSLIEKNKTSSILLSKTNDTIKGFYENHIAGSTKYFVVKRNLFSKKVFEYRGDTLFTISKFNTKDSILKRYLRPTKTTIKFQRDNLGKIEKIKRIKNSSNTKSVDYFSYDEKNRLKYRGNYINNYDTLYHVIYSYNKDNQVIEEKRVFIGQDKSDVSLLYRYDSLSNVDAILWWEHSSNYSTLIYTTSIEKYDSCYFVLLEDFNRLTSQPFNQRFYDYSNDGKILRYASLLENEYHYFYDDHSRLQSIQTYNSTGDLIDQVQFEYSESNLLSHYSQMSNRLSIHFNYNSHSQIINQTIVSGDIKYEVNYFYNEYKLLEKKEVIKGDGVTKLTTVFNYSYQYYN